MYNDLFTGDGVESQELTIQTISEFLYYSMSLSGRKPAWQGISQPRSAWSKRVNASRFVFHFFISNFEFSLNFQL